MARVTIDVWPHAMSRDAVVHVWHEGDHPRDEGGEFKGGGGTEKPKPEAEVHHGSAHMTNEQSQKMRNVAQIQKHGTRVIRGRIPAQVRKELMLGVKLGFLGHLKKDGLKPEIFHHPDHRNGAIERQKTEANYAIGQIRQVVGHPLDKD